jgi:short-subunit dehydrogenase
MNINLALVDIKSEALRETADRMAGKYQVLTRCLVRDLSERESWIACMDLIRDLDCRLLIYVPAYSPVRSFFGNTAAELDRYLHLNSLTPLHLVHAFAERNRGKGRSGIVLMSSLAGLIGPRFVAPYAATKAFNIVLAESLFHELKSSGIEITACCAGPTSTPTYWSSLPDGQATKPDVMGPEPVAACALKNLGKKAICIPGRKNQFFFFILLHLLPRAVASSLVSREMARMYQRETG